MNKNQTTELLIEGRARIARGWTQRVWARDAGGCASDGTAAEAVCWCALGALAGAEVDHISRAMAELGAALPEGAHHGVDEWNDAPGRTHEDVIALYDRAIERSRS